MPLVGEVPIMTLSLSRPVRIWVAQKSLLNPDRLFTMRNRLFTLLIPRNS